MFWGKMIVVFSAFCLLIGSLLSLLLIYSLTCVLCDYFVSVALVSMCSSLSSFPDPHLVVWL